MLGHETIYVEQRKMRPQQLMRKPEASADVVKQTNDAGITEKALNPQREQGSHAQQDSKNHVLDHGKSSTPKGKERRQYKERTKGGKLLGSRPQNALANLAIRNAL